MWFGSRKAKPRTLTEEDIHRAAGSCTSPAFRDLSWRRGSLAQALITAQDIARRKCSDRITIHHLIIAIFEFEGAYNPLNPEHIPNFHVLDKANDVHSFMRLHGYDPDFVLRAIDDACEVENFPVTGEVLPLDPELEILMSQVWDIAGNDELGIRPMLKAVLNLPDTSMLDVFARAGLSIPLLREYIGAS
jgi:hypothetical protein